MSVSMCVYSNSNDRVVFPCAILLPQTSVVLKNMVTVLHVDLVESFWWLWLFSLLQTGDTNEAQKWKDRTIKPCCCALVLPLNVFVVNEVVFGAEKRVNEYLISNAKSSTYITIQINLGTYKIIDFWEIVLDNRDIYNKHNHSWVFVLWYNSIWILWYIWKTSLNLAYL